MADLKTNKAREVGSGAGSRRSSAASASEEGRAGTASTVAGVNAAMEDRCRTRSAVVVARRLEDVPVAADPASPTSGRGPQIRSIRNVKVEPAHLAVLSGRARRQPSPSPCMAPTEREATDQRIATESDEMSLENGQGSGVAIPPQSSAPSNDSCQARKRKGTASTASDESEQADWEVWGRKKKKGKRKIPMDPNDVKSMETADLTARIVHEMLRVQNVAERSSKLKGTFVRDLKDAAGVVGLAVAEMQQRAACCASQMADHREKEEMAARIKVLVEELDKARTEIGCLRYIKASGKAPSTTPASTTAAAMNAGGAGAAPSVCTSPSSIEDVIVHIQKMEERLGRRMEERFALLRTEVLAEVRGSRGEPEPLSSRMDRVQEEQRRMLERVRQQAALQRYPQPPPQQQHQQQQQQQQLQQQQRQQQKQPAVRPEGAGNNKTRQRANERRRRRERMRAATGNGQAAPHPIQQDAVVGVAAPSAARGGAAPIPTQGASRVARTWVDVVRRAPTQGAKKAAAKPAPAPVPVPPTQKSMKSRGAGVVMPPRPPRSAAVTIEAIEGSGAKVSEAMRRAREAIDLSQLGIADLRTRRSITGGLVLEIPGPEGDARAEALAKKMQEALVGQQVRVARPVKRAELRVTGIEDSVTPAEVLAAIAAAGGCRDEDVRIGEIRISPSSLGTVWIRCPLTAARKLAAAGKVRVGWASAKIEALPQRPLQCYRCLQKGHVRQWCTSTVDRSARCYKCGAPDHRASGCKAKTLKCPLCADIEGRPTGHRLGGPGCAPPPPMGSRGVGRAKVALPSAKRVVAAGEGVKTSSPTASKGTSAEVAVAVGPTASTAKEAAGMEASPIPTASKERIGLEEATVMEVA